MSQFFRVAPLGATALVWTIGFIVALLYFGGRALLEVVNGELPDPLDAGVGIVLSLLIIYAWLRSVKGYVVGDSALTVVRAGPGRIHIAVENIESIKANPDIGGFFNNSLLSVGGVFGWAGKASVRQPLDIRSTQAEIYGTNPRNSVVLQLSSGRTIIVTPANPSALLGAIQDLGVAMPGTKADRVGKKAR